MIVHVEIVLAFLVEMAAAKNPCGLQTGYTDKIHFVNTTSKFTVSKLNKPNGIGFDLRLVYEWNLQVPEGFVYDGFLYKHVDIEKKHTQPSRKTVDAHFLPHLSGKIENDPPNPILQSVVHPMLMPMPMPMPVPMPVPISSCKFASDQTLWAISLNGTSVECKTPCPEFFPSDCNSDGICLRLKEGFLALPKGTNRLEVEANFGRTYKMIIIAYRRWNVMKTFKFEKHADGGEIIKFCNEEIISNQGVDIVAAQRYCTRHQEIAASEYPTGPPAGLEQYAVKNDLVQNRANVMFRWKDPYDISPMVNSIKRYAINALGGNVKGVVIGSEMKRNDSYHYLEITNVQFGKKNSIKITPYVDINKTSCGVQCQDHGYPAMKEYILPDIDACQPGLRYCDINASCVDLPSENATSALCSCPVGFVGNGISDMFSVGTGCKDFNACDVSPNKSICDPNAECEDQPPPSLNASCFCRPNYYGNGYKTGSGCTKLSITILLATAIPITLAAIVATVLLVRRIKISKNGTKSLSRFIVLNNIKYLAPTSSRKTSKNDLNSSGLFGEKYEINRECVRLAGILGRGNFGVVHKATLKLNGENKVVAVKTTAEPHSEEMEKEFLAEIALITSVGNHENIMSMIGCCTAGDSITFLITKFMKYGDLKHFLWDAREEKYRKRDLIYNLTEKSVYDIGMQVANGMEHLSGLRIIHGDIAARNILVDEGLRCKISDFGLANDVYRYGVIRGAGEKRVPIKWISPERMQAGRVPITWRSDVWSYGILLFESITLGAAPFSEVSQEELLNKLQRGYRMGRPASCSSFLYGVMLRCWEWTPSKRPSFKDLKQLMSAAITTQGPTYVNLNDTPDGYDLSIRDVHPFI